MKLKLILLIIIGSMQISFAWYDMQKSFRAAEVSWNCDGTGIISINGAGPHGSGFDVCIDHIEGSTIYMKPGICHIGPEKIYYEPKGEKQ